MTGSGGLLCFSRWRERVLSPSCICQPSVRTQPKQPLGQGLPTVPTKNFSPPSAAKSDWLAVGNWKGDCANVEADKSNKVPSTNIQHPEKHPKENPERF